MKNVIQLILFADDQLILVSSGDELQISAHEVRRISKNIGTEITTSKTDAMIFCIKIYNEL